MSADDAHNSGPLRPLPSDPATAGPMADPVLQPVGELTDQAELQGVGPWEFELRGPSRAADRLLDLATLRELLYTRQLTGVEQVRPCMARGEMPAEWSALVEQPQVQDIVAMLQIAPTPAGAARLSGWQRAPAPPTPVTVTVTGADAADAADAAGGGVEGVSSAGPASQTAAAVREPADKTDGAGPRLGAAGLARPALASIAADERQGAPVWLVPALFGSGVLLAAAGLLWFLVQGAG